MPTELKAYCVHCGGGMEYPSELQGEKIVCPHCNTLTTLGQPITPPPVPAYHPGLYSKRATIKTKSEFIGGGCVVQGIGILVIWIFPIGTIVGIVLLLLGSRMALKTICSNCGNPVSNKRVTICPTCHAQFKKWHQTWQQREKQR
jgi:hypothetical protein